MRVLRIVFLLSLALITGCGGPGVFWYNPDKTFVEAKQDCRACYYEARQGSIEMAVEEKRERINPISNTSSTILRQDNEFARLMKERGYSLVSEWKLGSDVKKHAYDVSKDDWFPIAGKSIP